MSLAKNISDQPAFYLSIDRMESLLRNPVTALSFDAQVRIWFPAWLAASNMNVFSKGLFLL
jgi:hypothetical protein